jgi:hypothetical protein
MEKTRTGLKALALCAVFSFAMVQGAGAATLALSVPDGSPGGTVRATVGFADTTGIACVRLTLDTSSGTALSTGPLRYTRNAAFFPGTRIGGEEANFVLPLTSGKTAVAAFYPLASSGAATAVEIVLQVAANAAPGYTQTVTLGGEVYDTNGYVTNLPSVTDGFTVLAMVDTDTDGMPDSWEQSIISANTADSITTIQHVLPGADFDGDGETNLLEYSRGTSPTDRLSASRGDVDGDTRITLSDAVLALCVMERGMGGAGVNSAADVNANGAMGLEEALFVLQRICGRR